MAIIDSQVHVYEANTPQRPWHTVPNWPEHVTGDEMVAAMDKVGVDGAIFISAFSMYQYDASYALEVQRAHPGRFALVKPVNPDDPAVAEVIADWKHTPGTVGIRIMMTQEAETRAERPGPRPHPACRRAVRLPGQHAVLGQRGRGQGADRPPPRHALHPRPSGLGAAPHAARPAAALGGPAQGAGARHAPQRGDQGQRRVHAVPATRIPSQTSGSRSPACSTPGGSTAACGAPTGPAPSRSSTTNRLSSRSARPTA